MGDPGPGGARPGSREPAILLAIGALILVLLGVDLGPKSDRFTFFMETFPAVIAAGVLIATRRRFPLTPLAYRLILVHACVLIVGGHYTYAEVPAGFWVRDHLGLVRNPYDRLGHFLQGFVPALLTREVLLRHGVVRPGKWLAFLVVCVCMAISASYEFLEWWTAVWKGKDAESFLGTQGDPWDTQWDMFTATIGASVSLLLLSRPHDRALARLAGGGEAPRP